MIWLGILLPFVGTCLGACIVFFLKRDLGNRTQKLLLGFASGVMVAASIWSLLIPGMEMAEEQGVPNWIPAVVGFLLGIGFLLLIDGITPHLHLNDDKPEGVKSNLKKSSMLFLAVTIHNIPEGIAVGVVFAGLLAGNEIITTSGALALSIGIAIQNVPEGAIVSMPMNGETKKGKSFLMGVLSGVVEPIAAGITILLSQIMVPILPYLLSFAAGAMIYVVVEELIPEASAGKHSNLGIIGFALGFALMMVLDVVLG